MPAGDISRFIDSWYMKKIKDYEELAKSICEMIDCGKIKHVLDDIATVREKITQLQNKKNELYVEINKINAEISSLKSSLAGDENFVKSVLSDSFVKAVNDIISYYNEIRSKYGEEKIRTISPELPGIIELLSRIVSFEVTYNVTPIDILEGYPVVNVPKSKLALITYLYNNRYVRKMTLSEASSMYGIRPATLSALKKHLQEKGLIVDLVDGTSDVIWAVEKTPAGYVRKEVPLKTYKLYMKKIVNS